MHRQLLSGVYIFDAMVNSDQSVVTEFNNEKISMSRSGSGKFNRKVIRVMHDFKFYPSSKGTKIISKSDKILKLNILHHGYFTYFIHILKNTHGTYLH